MDGGGDEPGDPWISASGAPTPTETSPEENVLPSGPVQFRVRSRPTTKLPPAEEQCDFSTSEMFGAVETNSPALRPADGVPTTASLRTTVFVATNKSSSPP